MVHTQCYVSTWIVYFIYYQCYWLSIYAPLKYINASTIWLEHYAVIFCKQEVINPLLLLYLSEPVMFICLSLFIPIQSQLGYKCIFICKHRCWKHKNVSNLSWHLRYIISRYYHIDMSNIWEIWIDSST